MLSPFWAQVDEVSQDLLTNEWPDARSKVFYHTYERNAAMSQNTKDILLRAQKDVSNSSEYPHYRIHIVTIIGQPNRI